MGVTDIRAYSTLGTNFNPRFLARKSDNKIVLDDAVTVATLAGSANGCALIPFRPNESPQSWMYCAVNDDYQKLSAPDVANNVTAYRVGIAEAHKPPECAPASFGYNIISDTFTLWTHSGVAGVLSNSDRVNDVIGAMVKDPVSGSDRWSLQVSNDKYYQVFQPISLGPYNESFEVILDVIPPINQGAPLAIEAIRYDSGATGHCIVVPRQSPVSPTVPTLAATQPLADSIYAQPTIAALRRGALVELTSPYDSEVVFVLDVVHGPNGMISFECVTAASYDAGDMLTGIPTIILDDAALNIGFEGDPIFTSQLNSSMSGIGTGYLSHTLAVNPFTEVFNANLTPQQDDYITFGVKFSDLTQLIFGRIIFNVGSTVDYVTDAYYADFTADDILQNNPSLSYGLRIPSFNEFLVGTGISTETFNSFSASDVRRNQLQSTYDALYGNQASPSSTSTFYPSNQWTVIQFPIRSLQRLGKNQNRTLANCNAVRFQFEVSGAVDVSVTEIDIGGGGQCDVGIIGSPYFYAAVKRSSLTGVRSNPSPVSRYGVAPRRQQVRITVAQETADPQVDWWDFYRWGGTVTSWRYVGSADNEQGPTIIFDDNNSDAAIVTNPPIDYTNLEPWPTIDLPFDLNGHGVLGTGEITGTEVVLTFGSLSFVPANILRWLPGTLMLVNETAYTLWNRPVAIDPLNYLIRTVENIGSGLVFNLRIFEPIVGNQHLPYVWGPDESGTFFAVGDPLRPGVVYFSKSNNPDSAPDTFNLEITAPSEPLIGGEIIDGLCLVASSHRWWALYPTFGDTVRYQKVQRAIPRGIAAPYGHCNDGRTIYFWGSDGIYRASDSDGLNLTEPALRNLFPHEGVVGQDVTYAGHTVYAPDYTRVASFRLSYCNGYLYADYLDTHDMQRTLVLDVARKQPAWSVDAYADPISCHYWIEGPEANLNADEVYPDALYPILVMGDANGNVFVQEDRVNDNGVPISAAISTFEFDGGDIRATQLWGDALLDAIPESGINVTPISDRIASGASTTIPASTVRQRSVVHASGIEKKTLGVLSEWTDDFNIITQPTKLFNWQPLHQAIPITVFEWKTQGTTFGLQGYMHIRQVIAAYVATSPVTLYITAYDGTSPTPITLPATGGAEVKINIPVSFNKGQLYFFRGVSDAPWRPYFDAWETWVGAWGRTEPYRIVSDVEAPHGISNTIPPQQSAET